MRKDVIVVSLGGSLIAPGGIDWRWLKKFKECVEAGIEKGRRFIIVTGGGKIAREYIAAGAKISEIDNEDKDWLGIHATRMNAHLVRTIFKSHAHPRINKDPYDTEMVAKFKESVLVAAGYRPGNSTDYIAVLLAKQVGARKILNLSNIDYVYDKDPRRFSLAKKIERISWSDFQKIVGNKWDPGANAPFDPVAANLAGKEKMEVAIIGGKSLANMQNYFAGEKFKGTVIV